MFISRRGGRTGGRRSRAADSRGGHIARRGNPTKGADLQRGAAEVRAEEAARAARLARRHAAGHAAGAAPGPPSHQLQVSIVQLHCRRNCYTSITTPPKQINNNSCFILSHTLSLSAVNDMYYFLFGHDIVKMSFMLWDAISVARNVNKSNCLSLFSLRDIILTLIVSEDIVQLQSIMFMIFIQCWA